MLSAFGVRRFSFGSSSYVSNSICICTKVEIEEQRSKPCRLKFPMSQRGWCQPKDRAKRNKKTYPPKPSWRTSVFLFFSWCFFSPITKTLKNQQREGSLTPKVFYTMFFTCSKSQRYTSPEKGSPEPPEPSAKQRLRSCYQATTEQNNNKTNKSNHHKQNHQPQTAKNINKNKMLSFPAPSKVTL